MSFHLSDIFSSYQCVFIILVISYHCFRFSLSKSIFILLTIFHHINEFSSIFITVRNFHNTDEFSSHQWIFIKLIIFTATKFNDTNHFSQVATLLNSLFIFDESFSKSKLLNSFHRNGLINSQEKMHPLIIYLFININ